MIQEGRRQEAGEEQEVEDLPPVIVEEVHTCLLCNGEVVSNFLSSPSSAVQDKEGLNLSFAPEKLWMTKYHYASCYFETGVYLPLYPPGPENTGLFVCLFVGSLVSDISLQVLTDNPRTCWAPTISTPVRRSAVTTRERWATRSL